MTDTLNTLMQLDLFTPNDLLIVDDAYQNADDFVRRTRSYIDKDPSVVRSAIIHPTTVNALMAGTTFNSSVQHHTVVLSTATVQITPKRLTTFRENCTCVSCGVRGNVYLAERHVNQPGQHHLNLYHVTKKGSSAVLMTVDHILPDSWYGRYDPSNFQTMCRKCNQKKQHIISVDDIHKIRSNLSLHVKSWVDHEYVDLLLGVQLLSHNTTNAIVKNRLEAILHSYRTRYGYDTSQDDVVAWKLDIVRDVMKATATWSFSANPWDSVRVNTCIKRHRVIVQPWPQRMMRWIRERVQTVVPLYASLIVLRRR